MGITNAPQAIMSALSGVAADGILSGAKNALLATTYADNYTIAGNGFSCANLLDIAAESNGNYVIDLSAIPAGKQVIFTLKDYNSTVGPITIQDSYSDDTGVYTGGTSLTCLNLNNNSIITHNAIIKHTVTKVTAGKDWSDGHKYLVGGAEIKAASSTGANQSITGVLKTGRVYYFDIYNANTSDTGATIGIKLAWFEVGA